MNKVVVTGRISSDIELKYTPAGVAMARFSIAVRDPYRKNDEGKVQADFFDVEAWRGPAEFAGKYLEKGSPVALAGRLKQVKWTTPEGQNRAKVIINADDVESNGPPKSADPQQPSAPKAAPAPAPVAVEEPDYDPFADDV